MAAVGSDAGGWREEERAWRIEVSRLPRNSETEMRFATWVDRRNSSLSRALELAREVALGEASYCFLTFVGGTGVGKTHLLCAIGWEWLKRGKRVRYAQTEEMLDRLRASFDLPLQVAWESRRPTFEELFQQLCSRDLLLLDDLGVEQTTEWAMAKLDRLVDYRYAAGLATVFATNSSADDLPPRIADRLKDVRKGRVVVINASSYRRTE
jgi:DNA replication protein DnaC